MLSLATLLALGNLAVPIDVVDLHFIAQLHVDSEWAVGNWEVIRVAVVLPRVKNLCGHAESILPLPTLTVDSYSYQESLSISGFLSE